MSRHSLVKLSEAKAEEVAVACFPLSLLPHAYVHPTKLSVPLDDSPEQIFFFCFYFYFCFLVSYQKLLEVLRASMSREACYWEMPGQGQAHY